MTRSDDHLSVAGGPDSQRLFLALWPEPALAAGLSSLADSCVAGCGGRAMPVGNLHMTMAFLGNVGAAALPALIAVGAAMPCPAFAFTLDRIGWWPRQGIVWAGVGDAQSLRDYAVELRRRLAALFGGFAGGRFVPHVTLLRGALRPPPVSPLNFGPWQASGLVLVASRTLHTGACYQRVASWPQDAAGPQGGAAG